MKKTVTCKKTTIHARTVNESQVVTKKVKSLSPLARIKADDSRVQETWREGRRGSSWVTLKPGFMFPGGESVAVAFSLESLIVRLETVVAGNAREYFES